MKWAMVTSAEILSTFVAVQRKWWRIYITKDFQMIWQLFIEKSVQYIILGMHSSCCGMILI